MELFHKINTAEKEGHQSLRVETFVTSYKLKSQQKAKKWGRGGEMPT